jgi:DNA topoisomerase 2-associated protein PAT1
MTVLTDVGRDFDFFGKTAKIADVMEEEQITYARSHTTTQPPPTQAARQAELQHQQRQTNYVQRQIRQQQGRPPPIPKNVCPTTFLSVLTAETFGAESCDLGKL